MIINAATRLKAAKVNLPNLAAQFDTKLAKFAAKGAKALKNDTRYPRADDELGDAFYAFTAALENELEQNMEIDSFQDDVDNGSHDASFYIEAVVGGEGLELGVSLDSANGGKYNVHAVLGRDAFRKTYKGFEAHTPLSDAIAALGKFIIKQSKAGTLKLKE